MSLSIAEIENTFIQHLGDKSHTWLQSDITAEDRRERIRIAIMKSHMENAPLPADPTLTFGQAFELAYHRPCEMRYQERDIYGRPVQSFA
jgi:hypothetical protein